MSWLWFIPGFFNLLFGVVGWTSAKTTEQSRVVRYVIAILILLGAVACFREGMR